MATVSCTRKEKKNRFRRRRRRKRFFHTDSHPILMCISSLWIETILNIHCVYFNINRIFIANMMMMIIIIIILDYISIIVVIIIITIIIFMTHLCQRLFSLSLLVMFICIYATLTPFSSLYFPLLPACVCIHSLSALQFREYVCAYVISCAFLCITDTFSQHICYRIAYGRSMAEAAFIYRHFFSPSSTILCAPILIILSFSRRMEKKQK